MINQARGYIGKHNEGGGNVLGMRGSSIRDHVISMFLIYYFGHGGEGG